MVRKSLADSEPIGVAADPPRSLATARCADCPSCLHDLFSLALYCLLSLL